ncbi:synaptophysin [Eurytemora carolleeae]|uniref:synaptophysin n=1 Tax=Eurytemora carolleeae TaxID=1294199 RepID=UPI000C75E834|nr:synaptophysin [Eurytemora carolleeae]|eukprot:XP_023343922.1 synaptophysin-like [Eurytemora affinis]
MPIFDLAMAVVLAFFWLASSSAWGHGLSGLKHVGDPENWIYQDTEDAPAHMCRKNAEGYVFTIIESCTSTYAGTFAGGNVSVLLGFLNVFLWSANTWFLYKETRMYNPNRGNLQNVESPTDSI